MIVQSMQDFIFQLPSETKIDFNNNILKIIFVKYTYRIIIENTIFCNSISHLKLKNKKQFNFIIKIIKMIFLNLLLNEQTLTLKLYIYFDN